MVATTSGRKAVSSMPINPWDLAKSIGALDSLDPERGLAPDLAARDRRGQAAVPG